MSEPTIQDLKSKLDDALSELAEVYVQLQINECADDNERDKVVTMLLREECDHIRLGRDDLAKYVSGLIERIERGEHRR